jgi:hypothetical protein
MGRLSATASKHFFNRSTGGPAIERKWASDLLLARLKTFELLPVPYFCDCRFRTNEAQGPNLGGRNLQRGWRLGLPSGQDVARAMGEKPLDDKKILIGKATGDQADLKGDILSVANGAFKGNCPLWTYILAEAVTNQEAVKTPVNENVTIQTPRLGPEILIQCSA